MRLRQGWVRGLGRELAPVDQLLDQAVVAGQLGQRAGTQAVEAAVAGPQAGDVAVDGEQDDHGAARQPVAGGARDQLAIAGGEGGLDGDQEVVTALGRRQGGEARGDQLAGVVAARVAAHAVGHRPQAALGQGQGAVLVQLAHQADMAAHAVR